MNKCHLSKKLSGYIDNQLSEKEKSEVEMHLQHCRACELELDRLKQISQKLKAWQPSGLDASFDSAVRNKIVAWELERGQVKMNKKTLAILIPSSALAGILVIAFLSSLSQVYLKREIRGGIRTAPETMGELFSGLEYKGRSLTLNSDLTLPGDASQYVENRLMNKGGEAKRHQYQAVSNGGKSPKLAKEVVQKTLESTASRVPMYPMYVRVSNVKASGKAIGDVPATEEYKLDSKSSKLGQHSTSTVADKSILGLMQIPSNPEGSVIVIQPTIPATGEGDKIIRSGTIRLEVEDGRQTYNQALAVCNELGGYMSNSNFYKSQGGRESGTIIMRIPKDKFTIALDRLSALGKVENINTNSEDVSQEYANLKSQLDAAMVVYNKMLEALQKRNVTIPDAVRLESELTPVLRRVEDLKNSIEYLNNAVSFTTISVDFYESEISVKALKESRRFIREGMLAAQIRGVKFLAAALPRAIFIGVLLVIAIGVILALGHWIKRRFQFK